MLLRFGLLMLMLSLMPPYATLSAFLMPPLRITLLPLSRCLCQRDYAFADDAAAALMSALRA